MSNNCFINFIKRNDVTAIVAAVGFTLGTMQEFGVPITDGQVASLQQTILGWLVLIAGAKSIAARRTTDDTGPVVEDAPPEA